MEAKTAQAAQTLKAYTMYYKDAQGNKFVQTTKPCTKAQAKDSWEDFNCFGTFKLTKMIAY
jgi:hypothetical protein